MAARAGKLATGTYDRLDPPHIKYLADNVLHGNLTLDETSRWGRSQRLRKVVMCPSGIIGRATES